MKIVMSNGTEYIMPNDGGIETLMTSVLKHYGYTETMPDVGQDFDDFFKFFNADGDDITDDVINATNGSRPPVKAVYVSSGSSELWSKVKSYVPTFNEDKTSGMVDGGLYVWVKDHSVWDYMTTLNLGAYKYLAQTYDCAVNALHNLMTNDQTDALGQADATVEDYRATHPLS